MQQVVPGDLDSSVGRGGMHSACNGRVAHGLKLRPSAPPESAASIVRPSTSATGDLASTRTICTLTASVIGHRSVCTRAGASSSVATTLSKSLRLSFSTSSATATTTACSPSPHRYTSSLTLRRAATMSRQPKSARGVYAALTFSFEAGFGPHGGELQHSPQGTHGQGVCTRTMSEIARGVALELAQRPDCGGLAHN